MKKGITVISLSMVILLLSIITTTIIYTNSDAFKVANKTKYAIELLDIQTKVDNYYIANGKYPSVATISFDVSKFREEEKAQISGENVTSNKITLYSIDFNLLGIKNKLYGNNKNSTDVYALSETTGKVYYIKGFEYKKIRYYTLTDELYNGLGSETTLKNYKEVRKEEAIFRVNRIEAGTEAVTVDVMIPKTATNISVTTNNSVVVSSAVTEEKYIKYPVNVAKAITNYVVTVKYTLNGTTKTVTYAVNNIDISNPGLSISMVKYSGYTVIKIEPNYPEEVAKIKCDKGNLTKDYFKNYGKTLDNYEYVCYTAGQYTVYSEDWLGNSAVSVLNVTIN